ncbi:MAG: DUF2142 domain-containing protein [Chloroflexi bacterium]|nr:DUF2142 domain-containing protein [Chloroflexota bacterium]
MAYAKQLYFILVLAGYLVAGALFAIYTPAWQAPDEPAHYNYIRQVATGGCCPRVDSGDWQSDYLSQLTSARFAPAQLDRLDTLQYEDHQPPLYYLLASVVYKYSDGDLIALRLLSVALGALVVCLSYATVLIIVPNQPQIALAAAALIAFAPQHLSMSAAVNNDALAEALVALALLWLIRYLQGEGLAVWQLALIVGAALWTKTTVYFLAPLALLGIVLKWRRGSEAVQALLRALAAFLLIAGFIGGLWWLRNISVYGFPDFLGLAAHDQVVADQPRTSDYIAQHGLNTYLGRMLSTTFKSFWGQFGWMALPLDNVLGGWIYRGFGLLVIAGLSGLLLAGRSASAERHGAAHRPVNRSVLIVLLATILLVALQFIYYNIEFQQWQGRYLFPALIPIAFQLSFGVDHWRARLLSRWEAARWLTPLAFSGLFALDIYLLFRVIVPGLSP